MVPHPITQRLSVLGVNPVVVSGGRPLSTAIMDLANHEGLRTRAIVVNGLLRKQLMYLFDSGLNHYPPVHEDSPVGDFPSDVFLTALEMSLRYVADDIQMCRQALNDFRVSEVDTALKKDPKKEVT